jgi:hypothetical protein
VGHLGGAVGVGVGALVIKQVEAGRAQQQAAQGSAHVGAGVQLAVQLFELGAGAPQRLANHLPDGAHAVNLAKGDLPGSLIFSQLSIYGSLTLAVEVEGRVEEGLAARGRHVCIAAELAGLAEIAGHQLVGIELGALAGQRQGLDPGGAQLGGGAPL